MSNKSNSSELLHSIADKFIDASDLLETYKKQIISNNLIIEKNQHDIQDLLKRVKALENNSPSGIFSKIAKKLLINNDGENF